jgi:hypothetical protein
VNGDLVIPTACGNDVSAVESLDGAALHLAIGGQQARMTMAGVAELHREFGRWLLANAWVGDVYVGPLDDRRRPLVSQPYDWAAGL